MPMGNGPIARAGGGIYRALGEEFAFALDDIRQKVIEQGWTGAVQTPGLVHPVDRDFQRWAGIAPANDKADQQKEQAHELER